MGLEQATDIIRQALMVALYVGAPVLIVGLTIGLAVSVAQAVMQVQEQTLSFVPKIIGMAVAVIILLPWAGTMIMEFARRMFAP